MPPAEYRASFFAAAETGALPPDLAKRLAPSAGLRNILVYQYAEADLSIIATAVDRALVDYGEYVRTVARWLRELDTVGGSPTDS